MLDTTALSGWQSVVCGACAGVVSRFVIAPLDVVKIRLQLQSTRRRAKLDGPTFTTRKYRGVFRSMQLIVREEGIRALWKGNLAAEYLYLLYGAIQFSTYNQCQRLSAQQAQTGQGSATVSHPFLFGAVAGATATATTYPLDLLRTRYASQGNLRVYDGILPTLRLIVATEGVRGLYRGLTPSLLQILPYMGVMFGSYETLREAWSRVPALHDQLPISIREGVCGGAAGVISKTAVFPLDVIRKRLQIQGPNRHHYAVSGIPRYVGGVISAARQIVRHEGLVGLYRGYVPGIMKAAPAAAVTFLVYGQLRGWMLHSEQDSLRH